MRSWWARLGTLSRSFEREGRKMFVPFVNGRICVLRGGFQSMLFS